MFALQVKQNKIPAPAVTICPNIPGQIGFQKMANTADGYVLDEICKDYGDLADCIETEGFNSPLDFVNVSKGVRNGFNAIQDPNMWVSDFTVSFLGLCHTLNTSVEMEFDFLSGAFFFTLNESLDYQVYVHDPDYFMINVNPFAMPYYHIPTNGSVGSYYYKMRRVHHKKIQNCNSDPSYKFSSCLKRSVSSRIGCRLQWDRWSDAAIPICTTMDQYR